MTSDRIRAEARAILEAVLNTHLPADVGVIRKDLLGWDSLKHVEILFALESEFGVVFQEDEMASLDSLDAIVAAVVRLRAA